MVELLVKRKALLSALHGAKEVYPHEFTALFKGNEEESGGRVAVTVTYLLISPLAEYGRGRASYQPWLVPSQSGVVASFHSHPGPSAQPSKADLLFFSRGPAFHFIACAPYSLENVKAFDREGREKSFKII